jgi:hypothetical protein
MEAIVATRPAGVIVVAYGVGAEIHVRVLVRRSAGYTAHGFTGHRIQRLFLTRRHASRLTLPAPILARRAKHSSPTRYAMSDVELSQTTRPAHGWTLASAALILLVVLLACYASHVRPW